MKRVHFFFQDSIYIILVLFLVVLYVVRGNVPTYFPFPHEINLNYTMSAISQKNLINTIISFPSFLYLSQKESLILDFIIFWVPSLFLSLIQTRKFIFFFTNDMDSKVEYISTSLMLFFPISISSILSLEGGGPTGYELGIFFMYTSILSLFIYIWFNDKKSLLIAPITFAFISFQFFASSYILLIVLLTVLALFWKRFNIIKRIVYIGIPIFAIILIEVFINISINNIPKVLVNFPALPLPINPLSKINLLYSNNTILKLMSFESAYGGPYYPPILPHFLYILVLVLLLLTGIIINLVTRKDKHYGLTLILLSFLFLTLLIQKYFIIYILKLLPTHINFINIVSTAFNNPVFIIILDQIVTSILVGLAFKKAFHYMKMTRIKRIIVVAFVVVVLLTPYVSSITKERVSVDTKVINETGNFLEEMGYPTTFFLFNNYSSRTDWTIMSDANSISQNSISSSNSVSLYYSLGSTLLTPEWEPSINVGLKPNISVYFLNYFGFKFLALDNTNIAKLYSESQYFNLEFHSSNIYIFKVKSLQYNNSSILLSSSITFVVHYLETHSSFPLWLNGYNNLSLQELEHLTTNKTIYVPKYFSYLSLYSIIKNKSTLLPTIWDKNSNINAGWALAYFHDYPQETYSNYILNDKTVNIKNYAYQKNIGTNYGVLVSNTNSTVQLIQELRPGKYVVLDRVLHSTAGGSILINLNNVHHIIKTLSSDSYYQYQNLGVININESNALKLIVTNLRGFNSLSCFMFVPYSTFLNYNDTFMNFSLNLQMV